MGLLTRASSLVAVVAAGCYSPELRDCMLACASERDCAAGQVCGGDGLCAAPEIAGTCASVPDGGIRWSDALGPSRDAAADAVILDAPTHGVVSVRIDGKGYVRIGDLGTCDSDSPQDGMCVLVVPLSTPVTVSAIADEDWRFDAWTTSTCPDAASDMCTFDPAPTTPIGAKFRRGDD